MPLLRVMSTVLLLLLLSGCSKQSETPSFTPLTNYYPLQPGKRFIYRLDSTLYVSFGSVVQTASYLAKDSIINTFQDNAGHTSYTVYRYTTDTLLRTAWQYKSAYYVTPLNQSVEVVDDNNLRFIKLTEPISESTTWKGNAHIDAEQGGSLSYLYDWTYTYQNINEPYTTLTGTFDTTLTVLQQDKTFPEGAFDPNNFQQRDYSVEVYAKGVGLIYKDFLHWIWQPLSSITPGYTGDSYGIRLSLIDHN